LRHAKKRGLRFSFASAQGRPGKDLLQRDLLGPPAGHPPVAEVRTGAGLLGAPFVVTEAELGRIGSVFADALDAELA
jgi:hypothetical protein